jgi:Tfp pilus assembly protein PilP
MTNQNPAMSSKSPQDRRLQHDILAKVNAHADRSMDRLFADIEELLGDEPNSGKSDAAGRMPANDERQSPASTYLPQSAFPGQRALSPDSSYTEAPAPTPAAKPTKRVPFWLKAILGAGITSIAAGSLGFWLVSERKVVLPQVDTSWLPFQSRVAPADAKFADYMRKSLAKINTAPPATTTPAATPFNPTTSIIAPTANPAAINPAAINPAATTKTIVTGTATPVATPVTSKIALVKTIQTGARPEAVFQIDGRTQAVRVGQKVGTSNWSLLTVAKGEVILKRKGGEIRSVYVGQKF